MAEDKYIEKIKSMSNRKAINHVITNYGKYILFSAIKVKKKYCQIPLECDDLFNVFVNEIPRLIREFDNQHYDIKLSSYMGTKSFYFMANYARGYMTNKYRILNNVIYQENDYENISDSNYTYDTLDNSTITIDQRIFNNVEQQIYNKYFVEGHTITYIEKTLHYSYYHINKAIQNIKKKVKILEKLAH